MEPLNWDTAMEAGQLVNKLRPDIIHIPCSKTQLKLDFPNRGSLKIQIRGFTATGNVDIPLPSGVFTVCNANLGDLSSVIHK
jgi:hypothetical protein